MSYNKSISEMSITELQELRDLVLTQLDKRLESLDNRGCGCYDCKCEAATEGYHEELREKEFLQKNAVVKEQNKEDQKWAEKFSRDEELGSFYFYKAFYGVNGWQRNDTPFNTGQECFDVAHDNEEDQFEIFYYDSKGNEISGPYYLGAFVKPRDDKVTEVNDCEEQLINMGQKAWAKIKDMCIKTTNDGEQILAWCESSMKPKIENILKTFKNDDGPLPYGSCKCTLSMYAENPQNVWVFEFPFLIHNFGQDQDHPESYYFYKYYNDYQWIQPSFTFATCRECSNFAHDRKEKKFEVFYFDANTNTTSSVFVFEPHVEKVEKESEDDEPNYTKNDREEQLINMGQKAYVKIKDMCLETENDGEQVVAVCELSMRKKIEDILSSFRTGKTQLTYNSGETCLPEYRQKYGRKVVVVNFPSFAIFKDMPFQ